MEMWRSKKVIAITVLATLLVIGSIGGVVLATDNGDDGEPEAKYEALLDRLCSEHEWYVLHAASRWQLWEEEMGVFITTAGLATAGGLRIRAIQ